MKILHFFLISLFFLRFIICEAGNLLLKYQDIAVLNYIAEFNNFDVYKNNRFEYVNVWGKLCFAENYSQFDNNCRQKYKGYNNKWIVLISSNDTLIEFNKIIEKNEYIKTSISSIVLNNETMKTDSKSFTTVIPIFSVEEYQFHVLKEYDINKEIHNYYVNITCNI